MTKTLSLLLFCAALLPAQSPPLDTGWTLNYAYQTKKTDMVTVSNPSSLSFSYPPSGSKANPSKPYLTGEWAGYLHWSNYIAPFTIQPLVLTPGKSIVITGNVTVTGTPLFNFNSEPNNTGTAPASLRPWFEGASSDGRWWSNQITIVLQPGPFSVVIPIDPAYWSDVNGHAGSLNPAVFAQDIAQVIEIGATNGGGSFYGHGVNVSAGTATLTITSFGINQ